MEPQQESEFIAAWEALTKMYRNHAGGLGSRLHQAKAKVFIAYAQWPDAETRSKAAALLPAGAEHWRKQMTAACSKMETLFEMDMRSDLLL